MYQDPNQEWPTMGSWIKSAINGRWSAAAAMDAEGSQNQYLVDGLLPLRGTSVWFGAGSTGKTQLLLWMAAAIASRRDLAPDWLGHTIKGRGHVLVLSAEDTSEQLFMRLRGITRDVIGLDDEAARDTCARIHVMPFISMTEDEFDQPNAGLFSFNRGWNPNETLEAIRAFIEGWNDKAETPEDRIIGVVMDSATSMAGFEATVSEAVTNFFFYLNRLCEALSLFWVIIGHTPKVQKINPDDPDADAAARLRGVALWTTAPRTTVEVRAALGPRSARSRGFSQKRPGSKAKTTARPFEAKPVIDAGLAEKAEDVVIVRIAKSNLHDAHRAKHFLVRHEAGAFRHVTHLLPEPEEIAFDEAAIESEAGVPTESAEIRLEKGTVAVWDLISQITDGSAGTKVSASMVFTAVKEWKDRIEGLDGITAPGTDPKAKGQPRVGAANWHLLRLLERGLLVKSGKAFAIAASAPDAPIETADNVPEPVLAD